MKILHVVDTIDPLKGGVSHAVRTMASEITKKGAFNEVLTLDGTKSDDIDLVYKVNNIGPSKGPWRYSDALIPWLLDNFSRFDAVIVHGLWLYPSFAVMKALTKFRSSSTDGTKKTHIPNLYIMPHGMLDPYFQRSKKRKVKAVRNWIYWKLIEGKVINNANGILFTCKQECVLANQTFSPYKPKGELIIGLGVLEPPDFSYSMVNSFKRICAGATYGKYLLFLGRIDDKKGLDLLLHAYNKLLTEPAGYLPVPLGPSIHQFPKLVIAGPGLNSEYGKSLEKLVDERPLLRHNVSFLGMLEGHLKWAAFYGCEAFILPSHQENFGIAVVEALACGKPVLISKQVNIHPEITMEHAGIIGDDTINGTYKILLGWVSLSESKKVEMQKQARKCYKNHFAVNGATNRLLDALSCKTQVK